MDTSVLSNYLNRDQSFRFFLTIKHCYLFLFFGSFQQEDLYTIVTFYSVPLCNKITICTSQFDLSALMKPVISKLFQSHAGSAAEFKRAGEGFAFAIHLMVMEAIVLKYFRTLLALKLSLI